MEFSRKSRRNHVSVLPDAASMGGDIHSCDGQLSFYIDAPSGEGSLDEIRSAVANRMKILQTIENASLTCVKYSADWIEAVSKQADSLKAGAREDTIGHFMLRIAVARKADSKRWFLENETALFHYRLRKESSISRMRLLQRNDIAWRCLKNNERAKLAKELSNATRVPMDQVMTSAEFFAVPWEMAFDVVRSRRCLLLKGLAILSHDDATGIIVQRFRAILAHNTALTAQIVPHVDEELIRFLNTLLKNDISAAQDFTGAEGIMASNLHEYMRHMPPCMRRMIEMIKVEAHAKHQHRLQLGIFLKDIGMNMAESLKWWRNEFIRRMDAAKFEKQYAYNVRYNYGKEGARRSMTAYSCMRVINSDPPAAGQHHGCPLKNLSKEVLRQFLGIHDEAEFEKIWTLVKARNYPIACTRVFEQQHSLTSPVDFVITHPNQFFDESIKLSKPRTAAEANAATPVLTKTSADGKILDSSSVKNRSQTTIKEDAFDDIDLEDLDL